MLNLKTCRWEYPKVNYDPSKIVGSETITMQINQRTINAGTVTEHRDLAGNPFWYATSAITDEEFRAWSKGGARRFVELQAELNYRNV